MSGAARNSRRSGIAAHLFASLAVLACVPTVSLGGDPSDAAADVLSGVWRMAPRVLRSERSVTYQEEATMTINRPLPDGRFPIITRLSKRVVVEEAGLLNIPGCEDQKECIYDEATEGIGSAFRSAFYVDYYAENWIDDLFTVKDGVMTADDGNGPIVFTKIEMPDGTRIDPQ